MRVGAHLLEIRIFNQNMENKNSSFSSHWLNQREKSDKNERNTYTHSHKPFFRFHAYKAHLHGD